MRRSAWLLAALLAATVGGPAPAVARVRHHHPGRPHRLVASRPHAFTSCASLVGYARRHYAVSHGVADPNVAPVAETPLGLAGPLGAAAPAPVTADGGPGGASAPFSTTNNQEAGVDEPDIVKTDGATVFAVAQGRLYATAIAGGSPRLVGSLDVPGAANGAQLLLQGKRLILISGRQPVPFAGAGGLGAPGAAHSGPLATPLPPGIYPGRYYSGAGTTIAEVDVSDPSSMRVLETLSVDGSFVDARQNGTTARLVLSSQPRAIVNSGLAPRPAGWIPGRVLRDSRSGRVSRRALTSCRAVSRPVSFSGLGMLSIITINFDRGLAATRSTALMADAQVVYGSSSSLYVATQRWIAPDTAPSRLPASESTVIDRFSTTDPDTTTVTASGEVPGYLLNQFSLSEFGGYLRVASTSRPIWWGATGTPALSHSQVTVLAPRGGSLEVVGQVSGLGAGQQIRSVRFLGKAGYVVTFRQIDPLYVIALGVPTAPHVAGQLELQGYSAYLHPVGAGRLLGIGQDVGPSASEPSGTQLELFDVSHSSAPRLLQRATLGEGSSSAVESDHHAFLFWAPTGLAVMPVQIFAPGGLPPGPPTPAPGSPVTGAGGQRANAGTGFVGAIGFHIDPTGISEVGRISHDSVNGAVPAIRRSLVIGSRLFTLSDAGLMASGLDTLTRQTFVAFPAPPSAPVPLPVAPAAR